jgi:AcrR family transcriptional regulator
MPRRRVELDRDEKITQILDVAARQLTEGGYSSLSSAAIARELGLAPNAVRWYFPSRAHLFVETLRRELLAIAARKPKGQDVRARILWWTDQFAPLNRHRGALQEQAAESEVMAEFLVELDAVLERMLRNAFSDRVPAEQLTPAIAAFRATVDGTYAERLSRARRHAVLNFTLDRLWGQ